MELRPYQVEWKNNIYKAFREGTQNVMGQLATGSGKTVIFSSMIRDGVINKRRCLILAHRGELISQAADKLYKGYGIIAGIIKAGYTPKPHEQVQIASVQTLINRKLAYPVDICIIDEAHHMQSRNSYGKIKQHVLEGNPNCKFLGVTATPCRTNGTGFKGVFDKLICGATVSELIKDGFLVAPKYYVSPLELKGVKISAGDYNLKDLSEFYQRKVPPIVLVDSWRKLADGKKTIGFAIDVQHSKDIVECFNRHNIAAAHIDGTTPDLERKAKIKAFTDGNIKVLYNVGVFDEGFDVPSIEAIQLARPSKSLIKYMQMVGRALRPSLGKPYAIVLDHSGLIAEHDKIEIDREWTLDGVEKKFKNKVVGFRDIRSGKVYKSDKIPVNIPMEYVELVELTLQEIDPSAKLMRDYIVLDRIASNKGYKPFWIWYRLAERVKKIKDPEKLKSELIIIANFFCERKGYKNGKAFYLVKEYIEKNANL